MVWHRVSERCECGHPMEVHWDRSGGGQWCSGPGCSCRLAQSRSAPVDRLFPDDPIETVRILSTGNAA